MNPEPEPESGEEEGQRSSQQESSRKATSTKEHSGQEEQGGGQEQRGSKGSKGESQWAQQYEEGRPKTQVDLNEASEQELEQLTGVGRERARILIEHRPFRSWEDVEKVPGFSQGMLEDLKNSGATLGESEKKGRKKE